MDSGISHRSCSQETQIDSNDLLKLTSKLSPSMLDKTKQRNFEENEENLKQVRKHVKFIRELLMIKSNLIIQRWRTDNKGVKRNFPEDVNTDLNKKSKNVCRRLCMDDDDNKKQNGGSVNYALRYSNQELQIAEHVGNLISYVENQVRIQGNILTAYWTESLMELTIDTLIRLCDSDNCQILRKIDQMICRLVNSIFDETEIYQGFRLEAISYIILKLCESPDVADLAIDEIIKILAGNFENFTKWLTFTENSTQLVRILLTLLKRFETKIDITGSDWKPRPKKDQSVFNLWKNQWRPLQNNNNFVEKKVEKNDRLAKLENLLFISLDRIPYLSPFLVEAVESVRKTLISSQDMI